MIDTDELMALLAKATAGEWALKITPRANMPNNNWREIIAAGVTIGEVYRSPDERVEEAPTTDADAQANAAAIVAAVNFCRTELPALIAERDAMREVLRPFERVADMTDHEQSGASVGVNVNLCRAARAALAGQP